MHRLHSLEASRVRNLLAVAALFLSFTLSALAAPPENAERLKQVAAMTNQAELVRIAISDLAPAVQGAAAQRVTEPALLARIAIETNNPGAAMIAVRALRDPALLEKVVRQSTHAGPRHEACTRLPADAIAWLAAQAKEADARMIALPLVEDVAVLERIQKDDPDERIRDMAASRIKGLESRFAADIGIAELSKEEVARAHEVRRMRDQAQLAKVAREDKVALIRKTAVERVTDQKVLAEVASRDVADAVRVAATLRLSDQTLLATLAKEDASLHVRIAAARTLTDKKALGDLLSGSNDEAVRNIAAIKVGPPPSDTTAPQGLGTQEEYFKEAMTATSDSTRRRAAVQIKDAALAARLATESTDPVVRAIAAGKLTDQTLLTKLATTDEDVSVRRSAISKLTNQAALAKIAATDNDAGIKQHAANRLKMLKAANTPGTIPGKPPGKAPKPPG